MKGTVVITGASAGFGEACARRFAAEGWRLVLAARRLERLHGLQQELGAERVHVIRLDVRDRAAVEAAFAELPAPFDTPDVLVNNAGLAQGLEPAWQTDLDDWDRMVDTNIKGVMYCTRALLPGMVERKRGHIVNIGSVAGNWPYPGGNTYGATKAFVQQFSRNLRADLLGTRVRVSNLEPGLCESEFSLVRFKGDVERATKLYEGKDPILPEDIAEMVHWVVNLPAHINVNSLEVMPVSQAWGPLGIKPTS